MAKLLTRSRILSDERKRLEAEIIFIIYKLISFLKKKKKTLLTNTNIFNIVITINQICTYTRCKGIIHLLILQEYILYHDN